MSLDHLIMFIAFSFDSGKSPNTIVTYLASLSYYFKLQGLQDLTSNFIINKMLDGARRLAACPDVRLPITLPVLKSLLLALPHICVSYYQNCLFQAMFSLAFHAFLRVGEMTICTNNVANNLCLNDISFPKNSEMSPSLHIDMRNFKHNLVKRPTFLEVGSQTDISVCPVKLIQQYLLLRGKINGPLFCYKDGQPITRKNFCLILRAALDFSKFDTSKYKPHSFRIGAATTAHLLGYSDSQIQEMGRWKSDSYRRYIRIPMLSTFKNNKSETVLGGSLT